MPNRCCDDPQSAEPKRETSSRAVEILQERFACGEIDKAEYEEKRQIISGPRSQASAENRSRSGCC